MIKGLYLCARKHRIPGYNIIYNDIEKRFKPDLCDDMRHIVENKLWLFSNFKYFICTPPCNYYSKANYRRDSSFVALSTKDLLPLCLDTFCKCPHPVIIENVNNVNLLPKEYDKYFIRFSFGGHTFWTNVLLDLAGLVPIKQNKQNVCRNKRDNNYNVDIVIKLFLKTIHSDSFLVLSDSSYSLSF